LGRCSHGDERGGDSLHLKATEPVARSVSIPKPLASSRTSDGDYSSMVGRQTADVDADTDADVALRHCRGKA